MRICDLCLTYFISIYRESRLSSHDLNVSALAALAPPIIYICGSGCGFLLATMCICVGGVGSTLKGARYSNWV